MGSHLHLVNVPKNRITSLGLRSPNMAPPPEHGSTTGWCSLLDDPRTTCSRRLALPELYWGGGCAARCVFSLRFGALCAARCVDLRCALPCASRCVLSARFRGG